MAVRAVSDVTYELPHSGSARLYKWEGITDGDSGEPLQLPIKNDKSVQVVGSFGSGGEVTMEASNLPDGATYDACRNISDVAIVFDAAGREQIVDVSLWFRPRHTAGTGVDVDVYLLCL